MTKSPIILTQKQKQKQILSSSMIQQLRLLSVSFTDLEKIVSKALEENPFLEENNEKKEKFEQVFSTLDSDVVENKLVYQENLFSNFEKQMHVENFSQKEIKYAFLLLESIDAHGFLKDSLSKYSLEWNIDETFLKTLNEKLKHFDPLGVTCKDIKDFLLLQIKEFYPEYPLFYYILEKKGLDLFKDEKENLLYDLDVSSDDLDFYLNEIKNLSPYPIMLNDSKEANIIPEASITISKGNIIIHPLSPFSYIQLNEKDVALYDTKTNLKFKNYLEEAKILTSQIYFRNHTFYLILEEIINIQKEFFLKKDPLKPLKLKDLSETLHFSISTVSRSIKEKYIKTPKGFLSVSSLLQKSIAKNQTSTKEIKKTIKKIIDIEDKSAPFSDNKIKNILNQKNIFLSRRTIAKYRKDMHILNKTARCKKEVLS